MEQEQRVFQKILGLSGWIDGDGLDTAEYQLFLELGSVMELQLNRISPSTYKRIQAAKHGR